MALWTWFQAIGNPLRTVLDVGVLAFFLYKAWELLTRTQAVPLLKGAGILGIFYAAAYLLHLSTLQWILQSLAPGLFIAVAIVFQPELRQIFLRLGQGDFFKPGSTRRTGEEDAAITAAEYLSRKKRGALLVFPRKIGIKNIIETGTPLNAEISSSLIITVFEYDTPLHDGAMVIQGGRIVAAGCFLPLSEQQNIRKNFGTRHRAALGMSEQSDAVILIVSEETGAISLAYEGLIYYDLSPQEATTRMRELLALKPKPSEGAANAKV
jgi:diadenylate cyclase